MSRVKRKPIRTETYRGHTLEARFMGPDLGVFVDGVDLNSFYIDANAAMDGGRRYVDAQLKAREETR